MNITDEMLMAYADGELSREDCRRLEAVLAQDAVLRSRLEPFAVTGSSLAGVFDQPMREPIPDRLMAVITAGGHRASPARGGRAEPVGQKATGIFDAIAEALFPRGLGFAGAFTLASLFAAGGVAGYVVSHMGASSDGATVVAAGDLKRALEMQPSVHDEAALRNGAALWPSQSFKSVSQGYCREYKIAGAGESGFAGVACRGADAEWRIAVHAEVKKLAAAGGKSANKQQATEERYWSSGFEQSEAVDAAVDRLKKGDVFSPEAEVSAIADGWSAGKQTP